MPRPKPNTGTRPQGVRKAAPRPEVKRPTPEHAIPASIETLAQIPVAGIFNALPTDGSCIPLRTVGYDETNPATPFQRMMAETPVGEDYSVDPSVAKAMYEIVADGYDPDSIDSRLASIKVACSQWTNGRAPDTADIDWLQEQLNAGFPGGSHPQINASPDGCIHIHYWIWPRSINLKVNLENHTGSWTSVDLAFTNTMQAHRFDLDDEGDWKWIFNALHDAQAEHKRLSEGMPQ